ncbi:MAG: alpha/beta hydrolase [Clostridiales Family XIII bacterium]|jgi:pimeloyl-ACP methyl ester carboxylesterase|nr:alpha/beta hydrolase [Clostridiales Family XIII bacterium]
MVQSILWVFFGIAMTGLLAVLVNSPGTPEPLRDGQGDVIPGTPLLQFISYLEGEERLEKYFTVCYWDQRGAGMTYTGSTDPGTMTVEQMVEDTRVVTEYLKERFGRDKIYRLGHSWGSYLGVKVIEKYPEDYLAYIGVGQVSDQTESERLAYAYMLERARDEGDGDVIEKLGRFDPVAEDFPSLEYLVKARTGILNRYGVGHLHQGLTFRDILKTFFVFKGYTLREKVNWFRGADFSMIHLFPVLLDDDLFASSAAFDVPFYVVQGKYDFQVSRVLAEEYLNAVTAPKKGFYECAHSAHSPNMEEPEVFIGILREIARENPGA